MNRAELKNEAKEVLRQRWGVAIAMLLTYGVIDFAISFLSGFIPVIGSIVTVIIAVPISFGFIGQWMKFTKREENGIIEFLQIGFNNFGKSWSIWGNTLLKLLPYIIILGAISFVTGILGACLTKNREILLIAMSIMLVLIAIIYVLLIAKSYLYMMTGYIGNDNLQMSGKDVVEESEKLMEGHRWEFFVLEISFLGWILLSVLTLGIGLLWVIPYIQVTNIKFYEKLANANNESFDAIINN